MVKYLNTYFVKGECERKFIEELKLNNIIEPGKIKKINIALKELSNSDLREFNPIERKRFIIVLNLMECNEEERKKMILKNIKKLKSKKGKVIVIVQNENLKEELIKATNINSITEILNSKSEEEWEKDMLTIVNFFAYLKRVEFDVNKLWSSPPPKWLENEYTSDEIKRGEINVKKKSY